MRSTRTFNMPPKSERVELRVDAEFLARVDEWRRQQPDIPSRSMAIRRLVDGALQAAGARSPAQKHGRK